MRVIGIDPGHSWGLCVVEDGHVAEVTGGKGISWERALDVLAEYIGSHQDTIVWLEQPPAVRGGAVSWWRNVMVWVYACDTLNVQHAWCIPSQWQSWAGILKGLPRDEPGEHKRRDESQRRTLEKGQALSQMDLPSTDMAAAVCLACWAADCTEVTA